MEAVAKLRNLSISPRKMRLVTDLVRGQSVKKALGLLKFEAKAGAPYLHKLILSAVANWRAHNPSDEALVESLHIKTVFVDGGKVLKRMLPAPQGRAYRIRKRSNHITLIVDVPESVREAQDDVLKVANTIAAEQLNKTENTTETENPKEN
ncbi:MAG: 50S ribosomal protein L22 [Cytophagales bacterium]|nr:MAG: 50S ribosomal protein L22 [Cytophagales bacterium]TAF61006.1 MAG: 50S ribosomal protein L22 [Cytophagales bacterium]